MLFIVYHDCRTLLRFEVGWQFWVTRTVLRQLGFRRSTLWPVEVKGLRGHHVRQQDVLGLCMNLSPRMLDQKWPAGCLANRCGSEWKVHVNSRPSFERRFAMEPTQVLRVAKLNELIQVCNMDMLIRKKAAQVSSPHCRCGFQIGPCWRMIGSATSNRTRLQEKRVAYYAHQFAV